jgi:hypothetical protein
MMHYGEAKTQSQYTHERNSVLKMGALADPGREHILQEIPFLDRIDRMFRIKRI